MAKTPKKTPKVRTDFAQNAHRIMLEATGQATPTPPPTEKNQTAQKLGQMGGIARKKVMSKKARSVSAKKAALARWSKKS